MRHEEQEERRKTDASREDECSTAGRSNSSDQQIDARTGSTDGSGDSARQNIWFFCCHFDRDYRLEQVLQTETPDPTEGRDPNVDTGRQTGAQSGPGTDGLTLGKILVLTGSGTGSGARPEAPSQWFRRTTGGRRGCETREGKDGDGGENHESGATVK